MPALYLAFGKAGGRAEDEEVDAEAKRARRVGRDPRPPAPGARCPVHADPGA